MATEQDELQRRADDLYERYARPLEAENAGRFIAVSPGGDVLLGDDVLDGRGITDRYRVVFDHGQRVIVEP